MNIKSQSNSARTAGQDCICSLNLLLGYLIRIGDTNVCIYYNKVGINSYRNPDFNLAVKLLFLYCRRIN